MKAKTKRSNAGIFIRRLSEPDQRTHALVPAREWGEGGDRWQINVNPPAGSTISERLTREYDATFAAYMQSRPGSQEARELFARLKSMPSC